MKTKAESLEAEAAWRCALSSKPDFPEALAAMAQLSRSWDS
jgi:hypothetical protein